MNRDIVKEIIKHITTRWARNLCPMCFHRQWNILPEIYELRKFHDGELIIGDSNIIPLVPVICKNCGNTILINILHVNVKEIEKTKPWWMKLLYG